MSELIETVRLDGKEFYLYQLATFEGLKFSISIANRELLTFSETVDVIHKAMQNSRKNGSARSITKALRKSIITNTGAFCFPKEGVYIQDIPERKSNCDADMNDTTRFSATRDTLIGRMNSGDPHIRFVPIGYEITKIKHDEFMESPYIRALCIDEETLEHLGVMVRENGLEPQLLDGRLRSTDDFSRVCNYAVSISGYGARITCGSRLWHKSWRDTSIEGDFFGGYGIAKALE